MMPVKGASVLRLPSPPAPLPQAGEGSHPSLVYCPHPLLAAAGRELHYEAFLEGESVGRYFRRLGYEFSAQPVWVYLNGHVIRRECWDEVVPRTGDLLVVRARVHGGGGDNKNPIAAILTIAVMVFAPVLAPGLATAMGVSKGVATALISFGANLLINALFPPPKPNLTNAQNEDNASPTYALTGGSNRARPFEPLLRVLGKQRVFPDVGAKTFTEFDGDDQYLYSIFHFGISDETADLVLSEFKIGETPITDFDGVEFQESGNDGALTLCPGNVDSVNGGNLTYEVGWVQKTSSTDTTMLAFDLVASLFSVSKYGVGGAQVTIEAEYRKVGDTPWLPAFEEGTLYNTHYWSAGRWYDNGEDPPRWIQIGYGSNAEDEHEEGDAAESYISGDDVIEHVWRWRPYTELNGGVTGATPYGPWPPESYAGLSTTLVIVNGTRKPWRRTLKLKVPKGQYQVRLRRVTPALGGDGADEVAWTALKSYQPDEADYTWQKRVAVKVRATGQLQGQIDQFNAVASCRTRVWAGDHWATAETSNPAWLMLATMRGGKKSTRRTWGCGIPESRINLEELKDFAAWCDAKSLQFNGVLDQRMNCVDLLNAIARCGRGSFSLASGQYGVVWDAPDMPVVQVFGLGNIKAGTFSVKWVSEKLGDEVVLGYWNKDTSQRDVVRALVPGVTNPENPVQVEFLGIDNTDQAGREANLIAAAQKYRRMFVTFESDFEAQAVRRGDVVVVSHDLFRAQEITAWGYSGRIVSGTTGALTLDAPVTMKSGETNYIAVRYPDGSLHTRAVTYASGEVSTVTLSSNLPAAPDADGPAHDCIWLFGLNSEGGGRKMKVHEAAPVSDKDVRVVLVPEDPAYYAHEDGTYTEPAVTRTPVVLPVVSNVQFAEQVVRGGNGATTQLTVSWDVTGGYDHANVMVWVDDVQLNSYRADGRSLSFICPESGVVRVSVLPFHALFGPGSPVSASHTVTLVKSLPPDVTVLVADDGETRSGIVNIHERTPAQEAEAQAQAEQALQSILDRAGLHSAGRLTKWITDAIAEYDPLTGVVRLKATAEITTDVEAHLRSVDIELSSQAASISAHTSTLDDYGDRITATESDISVLQGQISLTASTSYVDGALAEAMSVVDPAAVTAAGQNAAEGLLSALVDGANTRRGVRRAATRLATAEFTLKTLADADGAEAAARLALGAQLTTSIAAVSAAVTSESSARATAETALATSINTVSAALTTEAGSRAAGDATNAAAISTVSAAVSSEATARASADSALASSINTVSADLVTEAENRADGDAANADAISAVSAAVSSEETARASADSALASSINTVSADLVTEAENRADGDATNADAISAVSAAVSSEATARASADSALSSSVLSLTSRMSTAEDGVAENVNALSDAEAAMQKAAEGLLSALSDAANARRGVRRAAQRLADADFSLATLVDADKAEAASRLALAASMTDAINAVSAAVTSESSARSTADTAIATSINTVSAAVTTEAGSRAAGDATNAAAISTVSAAVSSEATARASADGALASSISTVSARVDDAEDSIASVVTLAETTADALGNAEARWAVTVSTMGDGTKAITGIELVAGTSGQSVIRFTADKLLVYKPDGSGTPRQIVTTGNINGSADIGIGGGRILDDAIVTRAIQDGAVTVAAFASDNGYDRYFTVGSFSAGSADDTYSTLTFDTTADDDITIEAYTFIKTEAESAALDAVTLRPHLQMDGADVCTGIAETWRVYRNSQHIAVLLRAKIAGNGSARTAALKVAVSWGAFSNDAFANYVVTNCVLSAFIRRR